MPDAREDRLVDLLGGPGGTTAHGALRGFRAPGRVNLIGDHTDYNDGFVLPCAIDLDCLVGARPAPGGSVTARSLDLAGRVVVTADGSTDARSVQPEWGRFVAGAVSALHATGRRVPPVELVIASTVPAGSGLSSSSALSVALTLTLAGASGEPFTDRRDAARTALDAEVRATGVPGGLMDQLCSLFGREGHALLIDCRDLSIAPVPLPRDLAILAVHSGVPRTLAGSAYAQRRAACEATAARLGLAALRDATLAQVADDPIARHVVTENARVLEFVDALRSGSQEELGPLLLASHASLRDDYRVSIPELDLLVELLVAEGALGARLTGAGFGGCVVALVPIEAADECARRTVERYDRTSHHHATAYHVRAMDGARPWAPAPS